MLNSQGNITVGHMKKRYFKAALNSFVLDSINGKPWDISDVKELEGLLSYYSMVEKDYFNGRIAAVNAKYNVDVRKMMKNIIW